MEVADTAAVKGLTKQAGIIGSIHAQVYLGVLSAEEMDDVFRHTGIRSHLRTAYSAVAAEIGGGDALGVAVNSARQRADAAVGAGLRSGRHYGRCPDLLAAAERAIYDMLAGASTHDRGPVPGPTRLSRPVLTVNGRPQQVPEGPETLERRGRLFVECVRRLAGHPLASTAAYGQLIGMGSGLEELVDIIAPLFEKEQSLVRWVALRGAIEWLYLEVFCEEAAWSPQEFAQGMGLAWARGISGIYELVLARPCREMVPEHRNLAIATANITASYLTYYQRIMQMSVPELNADEMCAQLDDDVALECIAWSAVASLRLGIDRQRFEQLPEPDALTRTGWYADPLSGAYQRYWDGSDWTAACRSRNGGRIIQSTIPLRLCIAAYRAGLPLAQPEEMTTADTLVGWRGDGSTPSVRPGW